MQPGNSRPFAVFGGTFDPIHYGHLELARDVRAGLDLDTVTLMPAGDPPHRAPPHAPAIHRLAMAELGVAEYSGLVVDGREVLRSGPSYTVLTLEELRAERPFQPLALVIGMDAFLGLDTWHRWRDIFSLAHLVVVARPGTEVASNLPPELLTEWQHRHTLDRQALEMPGGGSIYQQMITPHAISASAVRAALARGDIAAVRGLVPDAVLAYIGRNHLYHPGPDAI